MIKYDRSLQLTSKEIKISKYLLEGFTAKEIACEVGMTSKGVNYHLENIKNKLGIDRRVPLAIKLYQILKEN